MHRTVARIAAFSTALLASIALTACTAHGSLSPVAPTNSAVAATSSTPDPTLSVAAAAPVVRIGVACDDLTAAMGFATAMVSVPAPALEATTPEGAASRQAGILTCAWATGPANAQGVFPTPNAELSVSADVAAGAQALGASASATPLGVGTASSEQCDAASAQSPATCSGSAVTDTAWFWLRYTGGAGDAPKTRIEAAARGIAEVLRSAPVQAVYAGATGSWSTSGDCAALGTSTDFAKAVGATSPGSWGDWNKDGIEDPVRLNAAYAGMYNCVWQAAQARSDGSKSLITAQIVPGADWVWPTLAGRAGITSTALAVPGSDGAFYRCETMSGAQHCWGDALIDHAWVQVTDISGTDQSEATALLAAVAAGHTAS